MRNWLKTILFLSTFSPALVSVAIARYWATWCLTTDMVAYAVAGLGGVSLALLVIAAIKRHAEVIAFSAKKIESNDALMLGVIATYFIPFIGKASDITIGTMTILIGVVAVILWLSSSILPHPLLRLIRYRFYKVESDDGVVYTLITQRELLNPKNIRAVKRISSSMLVEVT
jgi:hypothetical protein